MEKNYDTWIKHYWRPAIAWQYLLVCLFDFLIAPSVAMGLGYIGGNYVAWVPLTLGQSGFYHMAMLGIVGVSAYSRGQEKTAKINSGIDPETSTLSEKETELEFTPIDMKDLRIRPESKEGK